MHFLGTFPEAASQAPDATGTCGFPAYVDVRTLPSSLGIHTPLVIGLAQNALHPAGQTRVQGNLNRP